MPPSRILKRGDDAVTIGTTCTFPLFRTSTELLLDSMSCGFTDKFPQTQRRGGVRFQTRRLAKHYCPETSFTEMYNLSRDMPTRKPPDEPDRDKVSPTHSGPPTRSFGRRYECTICGAFPIGPVKLWCKLRVVFLGMSHFLCERHLEPTTEH